MRVSCILGVVAIAAVVAGCDPPPSKSVASWPDSTAEAYRGAVAALMWPGATRAYQVTAQGHLFNGAWLVRIDPSVGGVPADSPRVIAYADRWCPVVRWSRMDGSVRWDFEAVAFPEPEPGLWSPRGLLARWAAARARAADVELERAELAAVPRDRLARLLLRVRRPVARTPLDRRNLSVSLLATATNLGTRLEHARLSLELEPPGNPPPFWDSDSAVRVPWEHGWSAPDSRDSIMGLASGVPRGRIVENDWRLHPGESATLRALLPAYPAPATQLRQEARASHDDCVRQVRNYWTREVGRGAAFDVPDPEVRDAIRAARVVLLASRERRDVDWVPIGGPFHYRDVWVRDGARVAEALAVSGYTRESREFARSFLRFQSPLGTFVSQASQLDGTGQVLWAFEQTLLRPSVAPDIRRFGESALDAWRALECERALAHGRSAGAPGMLPETDPHDAELVRAQLVGNDAWSVVGYRAASRLLRAANLAGLADSVVASRDGYLTWFRYNLSRTRHSDIPPSWQGAGIDWGNLNVAYPCEVLPPDEPRLLGLADRYWARVGGPGLGYYNNPDSLHTYCAADLGTWALLRGDREMADKILSSMLYWRTASGGAAEMFSRSTREFGSNYPPHTTAAAALIALVRNALVFDDGDTLQLALGAPAGWWKGTAVRSAPTRWGLLDLRFRRDGNVAKASWTRVPVWTLLALPPRTRPAGPLPLPLLPGPRPDLILIPPGTSQVSITLAS